MDRPYRDLAQTLAHGASVGGYLIEERIGVGGFGEVYSARQPTIDRMVAIKILHARFSNDAGAIARFVDEARAVNQIAHPNIVEVYDFGNHDGRAYIVMELIEGELLRGILDTRGRLPLAEALPILRAIAEALDAAHARGIAHRDLKPDNVFVTSDGRTKLIDFGIAKLTHEDAGHTETGAVFGTPHYMSPEQCRGRGVGTRTDLYSFGALAYRMLTGEPPFGGDPIELALHHLNDRPEPPSGRAPGAGLSREVDRVLLALLAKDPAERPASLGAAVAALSGQARLKGRDRREDLRLVVTIGGAMALFMVLYMVAANVTDDPSPATEVAPGYVIEGAAIPCNDGRAAKVWNPTIKAALSKRFATAGADAISEWNATAELLDRRIARWQTARSATCLMMHWSDGSSAEFGMRSVSDATIDRRLLCLDRALVPVRATVAVMNAMDPKAFTAAAIDPNLATSALADCENDEVLRLQPPPPKMASRARIAELSVAADRAAAAVRVAQANRDVPAADVALADLGKQADAIAAIDGPAASSVRLARIQLLTQVAALAGDAARWLRVLDDAAATRAAIEAAHDPRALAVAGSLLAVAEMTQPTPPTAHTIEIVENDVAQAEVAVASAGKPLGASIAVAKARSRIARWRGDYARAEQTARLALSLASGDDPHDAGGERELVLALALAGEPHDAAAEASHWIARGAGSMQEAHELRSGALQLAGDLQGALTERNAAIAAISAGDLTGQYWGAAQRTDLALQVPSNEIVDVGSIATALSSPGVSAHQIASGLATARRFGMWALFERVVADGGSDATPIELAEDAARIAIARGDVAAAGTTARVVVAACASDPAACKDTVYFARWIALVAAPPKTAKELDLQLAALEAEFPGDPMAAANSGIALAMLGRWEVARPRLESARASTAWPKEADLADLDAWLGLARLAGGDEPGARIALEESLAVIGMASLALPGFTGTQPAAQRALAGIVWASGDRVRARALAQLAFAGWGRLGDGRAKERAETAVWLAAHP